MQKMQAAAGGKGRGANGMPTPAQIQAMQRAMPPGMLQQMQRQMRNGGGMQEMMKAMMQGQGGDQMDMEEMQSKDELCLRWYSGTDELSGMMASMGNGLGGLGGLGGPCWRYGGDARDGRYAEDDGYGRTGDGRAAVNILFCIMYFMTTRKMKPG